MKNILYILLVSLLFSCSEKIRVYTDKDSSRDIQRFSTYAWGTIKNLETDNNPIFYNELNDKRIKAEVNNQLQAKGYNLRDENPQLVVHYHIVIKNEIVQRDMSNFYHGARWIEADRNSYSSQEGTLIIDLMDATTDELIWRGYAVSVLDEYRPDIAEETLRKAIVKIFSEFPPSSKLN